MPAKGKRAMLRELRPGQYRGKNPLVELVGDGLVDVDPVELREGERAFVGRLRLVQLVEVGQR